MSSPKDASDPGRVKSGTPKGGREGGTAAGTGGREGEKKRQIFFSIISILLTNKKDNLVSHN